MSRPWQSTPTELVVLEQLRYGIENRVSQQLIASVELRTWQDHLLDQLVVQMERSVHAQQLASEHIDVDFTRQVPVTYRAGLVRMMTPRTRRDLVLMLLPRWLRWRAVRYKSSRATYGTVTRKVPVNIRERVKVQRYWSYPDSTYALPEDTWGRPVVVERLLPPD